MLLQYCKEYTRCSSLDVCFFFRKQQNIKQHNKQLKTQVSDRLLRLNETTVFTEETNKIL